MKNMWLSYAVIWLSVALAVSVGLYVTKDFKCLWFLLLPTLVHFRIEKKDGD